MWKMKEVYSAYTSRSQFITQDNQGRNSSRVVPGAETIEFLSLAYSEAIELAYSGLLRG